MTLLEAKAADQTKLLGLNYTYYNNSNVAAQRITGLVLDVTENYTYDRKNRLADAREDGSVWTRVFGYDAWGNGWVESGTGVPIDPFTPRNSRTTTSQDVFRKILMANPAVMITPRPAPKWNRR